MVERFLLLVRKVSAISNIWQTMKYVILIVLLIGCVPQKKIAKICAEKFPVRDSTIIIEKTDSVVYTIAGDTIQVPCQNKDSLIYIPVKCPEKKGYWITKYKDKIVYRENTAMVAYQQKVIDTLQKKNALLRQEIQQKNEKIKELRKYKNYIFAIIICVIIYIYMKIKPRLW